MRRSDRRLDNHWRAGDLRRRNRLGQHGIDPTRRFTSDQRAAGPAIVGSRYTAAILVTSNCLPALAGSALDSPWPEVLLRALVRVAQSHEQHEREQSDDMHKSNAKRIIQPAR